MSTAGQSVHDGNPLSHLVTIGGEWILRPLGFRRRQVHFQGIDMEVLEGRGRGGPDDAELGDGEGRRLGGGLCEEREEQH